MNTPPTKSKRLIALKLSDFTITEGGFGSDMGFEKACNIKVQQAGRGPDCAVVVATLRGLKANSGHYDLRPGQPLPPSLFEPDADALKAGFANLKWHIENAARYGMPVVVAINCFPQDCELELAQLAQMIRAEDFGTTVEVALSHAFARKGAPRDFALPVRGLRLCAGAGFVIVLCGNVMTMPGLPEKPAFMALDLDEDGNITGLS